MQKDIDIKHGVVISDTKIEKELNDIRLALGETSWLCKSSIMFMFRTKYGSGLNIIQVENIYDKLNTEIKDNDEEAV